jgi:hypothetical protein
MRLWLPRYIIAKPLASGTTGFYFNIPTRYRKMGCTIPNEPLGNDYVVACGVDGNGGRAAALNRLFDEWWKIKKRRAARKRDRSVWHRRLVVSGTQSEQTVPGARIETHAPGL